MRSIALLVLFLLSTEAGAAVRTRSARSPGWFPLPLHGSKVLWIAAHPDDELLIAPLLGELCVEHAAQCSFLVLTRGEAGVCRIPEGCLPSVADVRTREMEESARLFEAQLTLWDYADGTPGGASAARERWAAAAGSDDRLLRQIAAEIDRFQPELLFTFDPRHGSTCHTDHQAVGAVVLDALDYMQTLPPLIYLAADQVRIEAGGGVIRFFRSSPEAVKRYNANQFLPRIGGPAWDYLLSAIMIHRSQFGLVEVVALANVPAHERMIHVLPVAAGTRFPSGILCTAPLP